LYLKGTWVEQPILKDDVQLANKYMKKCSPSLGIKEMQSKALSRFHLTPVRMAVIKKTNTGWSYGSSSEAPA
jgi:hypothetical protein